MRNIMRDPIEKNMLYERIQRYVRNMVGSRLLCPECKELKTCEGLEGRKMRPVLDCGHRRMEYESALTRNLTDEEFKKLMAEQCVFEAKRKKKYAGTKPLSTPAGATLRNAVGFVQTCGLNVTNTVTPSVDAWVSLRESKTDSQS
jgi:hypothetical protein